MGVINETLKLITKKKKKKPRRTTTFVYNTTYTYRDWYPFSKTVLPADVNFELRSDSRRDVTACDDWKIGSANSRGSWPYTMYTAVKRRPRSTHSWRMLSDQIHRCPKICFYCFDIASCGANSFVCDNATFDPIARIHVRVQPTLSVFRIRYLGIAIILRTIWR